VSTWRWSSLTPVGGLGGRGGWKAPGDWLVARAIEHDTPSVLFRQALELLRTVRVVRPGLDRLARAVATARVGSDEGTHRRLLPALAGFADGALDALLVTDPARRNRAICDFAATAGDLLRGVVDKHLVASTGAAVGPR
jgi:hypothetical protein